MLWFGLFERAEEVDAEALLPDPAGAWAGAAAAAHQPRPNMNRRWRRCKAHIEAGDVYQANLTFQAEVRTAGHPLALYAALRPRARAGHGAHRLHRRALAALSLSPELFFTLEGGRVTTRPMKGTAPRRTPIPAALRDDPKQRAENLMIVDLLRNDLSRVAEAGQRRGAANCSRSRPIRPCSR